MRVETHSHLTPRILVAAALALAVLIWLGPLASSASAKQARLPCLNEGGTAYKAKYLPSRCAHFGPGGAFGGGVDLHDITWDNWNTDGIANGRGTECGFDANCPNTSVEILAYRIRKVCGRRMFTRIRATSLNGFTVVKTRGCLGRA